MPLCPHCGQEVSFSAYAWNTKNYNRNLTRFNRVYTCNNCGGDFQITFGSRLLTAIPMLLLGGLIYLNYNMKFLDLSLMFPIIIFTSVASLYGWWKMAAQLESCHE